MHYLCNETNNKDKMKRLFYLLSTALVLAVTIVSCAVEDNGGSPVVPPEEKVDSARLTIIFYGTVGGNADSQAETAWEIMKPYLHQKDVRVMVCYKYAKPDRFDGKYAKPGDLVLFELTDTTNLEKIGENYAIHAPELALYKEEMLTEVINLAVEKVPARDYAFLVYGHGGGFDMDIDYEKDKRKPQPNEAASRRAVLYDEWIVTEAGKEAMNMYEFLRGIFNSKVPHFQSIFFHNCLMGGVESLLDISLFCDYIVCSSHLLSQNPAPVRQMINAVSEQKDIEKAYSQMIGGMLPEWESGYVNDQFNGDLKLINCDMLLDEVCEPSKKLAMRLMELYPTMHEQLDTAMVHTYQYMNQKNFYDLGDYANKVAEYTKDPELITIAKELNDGLDKAILARQDLHYSPYGDLPKFSLSVVLSSQEDYGKETKWDYTYQEAYEYTNWHLFTGWGDWLKTTTQGPRNQTRKYNGQPVGQYFFPKEK